MFLVLRRRLGVGGYIISIYRAKREEMGRLRFGRPVMIIGDGVEIEVSVAFSSDCLGAAG